MSGYDVELTEQEIRAELELLQRQHPDPPPGSRAATQIARLKGLVPELFEEMAATGAPPQTREELERTFAKAGADMKALRECGLTCALADAWMAKRVVALADLDSRVHRELIELLDLLAIVTATSPLRKTR